MEYNLMFFYTALAVGILTIWSILKNANLWYYTYKFSSNKCRLPPGDMGWPFFGNMLHFVKCLGSYDLASFVSYYVTRYGKGGLYKAYMFGRPTVFVTSPELCRKVLMDDENFDLGFPQYILELLRKEPTGGTTYQEDRLARRLTTPIKSHGLVSFFFDYLSENVKTSFEKWSASEKPIELLAEMKKPTFAVLMRVLLGGDELVAPELLDVIFKENNLRFAGLRSLPINIPGFAHHRAMKGRQEIIKVFQRIINERKAMIAKDKARAKSNILDIMLSTQDDDGKGLRDENILKTLMWYTFSGYESVAKVATQTMMLLQNHPECLKKAKEEQEEIVKRRTSPNEGLSFSEFGQMKYVANVINETLRLGSTETVLFRDARTTVNLNGYTIPEGWKCMALLGNFYKDPDTFEKPNEFNPSRWDDLEVKPSSYLPFGVGLRMCPGANLVRLEVSVVLHYFLLNYRLDMVDPDSTPEKCLARFKKLSA